MKNAEDSPDRKHRAPARTCASRGGAEMLLRSEVAFWRETIAACGADHPAASIERMRQALALAEYRLMGLYGAGDAPAPASDCPDGTSGDDGASLD